MRICACQLDRGLSREPAALPARLQGGGNCTHWLGAKLERRSCAAGWLVLGAQLLVPRRLRQPTMSMPPSSQPSILK